MLQALLLLFLGILLNASFATAANCDVSTCSVVIYKDCPNQVACGPGCSYLPLGYSSNPSCASNPCTAVVGNGNWQSICGGIDALDVKGPCNAQLARGSGGVNPYTKVFKTGLTGVWRIYENSIHFGDNAQSVKLTCSDVNECSSNSTNNCNVNAICTNTVGSYTCKCKNGFSGDGFSCADIDECATNSHKCSANADCKNTIGSHTCTCDTGYFGNGTHCDNGTSRIVCKEHSMEYYLDSRTTITSGTNITLRSGNCSVVKYMPNNEYGLVTNYKQCGTTMSETSTHITYTNEVIWTSGVLPGGVIRSHGKRILFTCSFPRFADSNIRQFKAPVTLIKATESGYGSFQIALSMFTSPDSAKVSSFPATVKLNSLVYFEAAVSSPDTDIILLFERCSASPTMDKNHPNRYHLIKDRCGADSSVQFHKSTSVHKNKFSFKSFSFLGQSSSVYIHCQVFMCHKQSTDLRCTGGCQGNNVNRLRRSIETGYLAKDVSEQFLAVSESKVKKVQRREIKKQYLPSKEYSLSIGPFQREGIAPKTGSTGLTKGFTAIHGMAIGIGVLVLVIVTAGLIYIYKLKTKRSDKIVKKQAVDLATVNQGYQLDI